MGSLFIPDDAKARMAMLEKASHKPSRILQSAYTSGGMPGFQSPTSRRDLRPLNRSVDSQAR
jgi:hypothetical protein